MHTTFYIVILDRRDYLQELDVDCRIILKRTIKKYLMILCTRFNCLG
jgi:hypothetical protein